VVSYRDENARPSAPTADFADDAGLAVAGWTPAMVAQLTQMIISRRFDTFADALSRVGNCARPIRLRGTSMRIDRLTGEVVSTYSSADHPDGVTYIRCGNRRTADCPSCSRQYAADLFQLIRAGVTGGKTVPRSVADNPLVFATVTAPSFGHVHSVQACGQPQASAHTCVHGVARRCRVVHAADVPALGTPLCDKCYDYTSQVVWQWWAPDLWRRFTIDLRRLIAKTLGVPGSRIDEVATLQYAKVAEYQRRGVVHFHALIRLDGPRRPEGFAPAPGQIDRSRLAALVRAAASAVRLTVPGVDRTDPERILAFGQQLEIRPVRIGRRSDDQNAPLVPEQVAGYLAKYATKSADDTGPTDSPHRRRIDATIRDLTSRALIATLEGDADADAYLRLGKWVRMLGFRGHFSSKSKRYAITLGALRRARHRASILIAEARASRRPLDLATLEADLLADADDDTTLVIGHWAYAGAGWNNDAEVTLALAAAARAREYAQQRAENRCTVTTRPS